MKNLTKFFLKLSVNYFSQDQYEYFYPAILAFFIEQINISIDLALFMLDTWFYLI